MAADHPINREALLQVLRQHIGRARGITATALCREVLGYEPTRGDERHLRHVIEELRREGHHVCGKPRDGYFLAETPQELDTTCLFLYARAMSSLEQIARMKRVSVPDLHGQLRLPT